MPADRLITWNDETGSYDTTVIASSQLRKHHGWCEEQGVDHAWQEQGYVLTTNPAQYVRICTNCGKEQRKAYVEPEWKDV